jgi:hypothetical protein
VSPLEPEREGQVSATLCSSDNLRMCDWVSGRSIHNLRGRNQKSTMSKRETLFPGSSQWANTKRTTSMSEANNA